MNQEQTKRFMKTTGEMPGAMPTDLMLAAGIKPTPEQLQQRNRTVAQMSAAYNKIRAMRQRSAPIPSAFDSLAMPGSEDSVYDLNESKLGCPGDVPGFLPPVEDDFDSAMEVVRN